MALDCRVMTIVRNGADTLSPCIKAVAPHVKSVHILLDSRWSDHTHFVMEDLKREFPNVEIGVFHVEDPLTDLVAMRNAQLEFKEEFGFVVDSDEYHHQIENYVLGSADAYAFQCHAPWNDTQGHKASARAVIGRIFRNRPGLKWKGRFGKEKLCYANGMPVFTLPELIPYRYIHLTHLKKDTWREEVNQKRVADGKSLYQLPPEIIETIKSLK